MLVRIMNYIGICGGSTQVQKKPLSDPLKIIVNLSTWYSALLTKGNNNLIKTGSSLLLYKFHSSLNEPNKKYTFNDNSFIKIF